ncbi:MAG: RNA polymerase sigma factor [Actinobacteria bacterium]|nr:RNA polymerase sigma factor [Actinomycetota bacterium]MCI0678148.1 RNA polymerase sigma factor [Actinomycetota bacterium]
MVHEPSVEGRPLDETRLLNDARRGDQGAFEELVRIHQHDALRLAYLLVGDHAEAEDVTQEAFVKAYRAMSRFRSEAPFRPWLLAIVRNEASNRRRSRGRRLRLAERVAAEPLSGDAAPSPETVTIGRAEAQELLDAVGRLGEKYRMVIVCRYLLGLTESETATVLGVPDGTVKSRCSRGLERLRASMEGQDD